MSRDPIVEEIHRVREKMMAEAGGDPKKLCDLIRSKAAVAKHRLVLRIRKRRTAPSIG